MAEHQAFANLLNNYLRQNKRSARWLAHEIGVHPSTVSRWTNGETLPEDPQFVRRIAAVFKLSEPSEVEALISAAGFSFTLQERGGLAETSDSNADILTAHGQHWSTEFNTILLRLVNAVPPALAAPLFERFRLYELSVAISSSYIYASSLKDKGINLAHRRLFVSDIFGGYFAGLLERDDIYVEIPGQVDCPVMFGHPELAPLSRIMLALQHPQAPHIVVIAAEGGMGKSTLTAKVVRSLYEQQMIEEIRGDSAKMERVNPVTGEITRLQPGYYDWQSCCAKLYAQLGLPPVKEEISMRSAAAVLRNRLIKHKTVIVIDNLESVTKGGQLLSFLSLLTSEDVRIIVTTRTVQDIDTFAYNVVLVNLRPITLIDECRKFLLWHLEHFQQAYTELRRLNVESISDDRIANLIKRTGGIPLLLQLIISTIARSSWAYLDALPNIFGRELLNFLYKERWQELGQFGQVGLCARELLGFVSRSQNQGKIVTWTILDRWSAEEWGADDLQTVLRLLHERFLILNHDLEVGNFTVFPSLSAFLDGLELV